jgi:hypothetical protein
MPDKLVTAATFATPLEADLARNRLQAENIPAVLSDDATVGWFWFLGNALGGIKLQVPEEQLPRALAILGESPEGAAPSEAEGQPGPSQAIQAGWTCTRCGAQVNPAAEVCPDCGTPADDLGELAGPSSGELLGQEGDDEYPVPSLGDSLATRAVKAAIIGLLACPPLLHLYSFWLLIRLALHSGEVSPAGMRKVYVALVIDLAVFGVVVIAFLSGAFR